MPNIFFYFILFFLGYLTFISLLDLVIPVNESQTTHFILGVMSCTKVLLPNLKTSYINQEHSEDNWRVADTITEKFLQVYYSYYTFLNITIFFFVGV